MRNPSARLVSAGRLVVCAAILFVARIAGAAEWQVVEDHWYHLSIGGATCGSVHAMEESDGERIRTTKAVQMRLSRAGIDVAITTESVFLETMRGDPIEGQLRQQLGGAPIETSYAFAKDAGNWKLTITDSAGSREKVIPNDGWLAPAASERYVRERMKAGAKEITYRMLDVESGGEMATIEMKRKGTGQAATDHEATPRMVQVGVWSAVNSLQKIEETARYGLDAVLLESEVNLGLGAMKTKLTTKDKAIQASQKSGAEIMVKSFVPAKRRIFDVMEKKRLRLKVTTNQGEIIDLPSAGGQRVTRVGPNELEVEIDADRGSAPAGDEATAPMYLGRSPLIDGSVPEVRAILDAALPKDHSLLPRERAEALRKATERALPNKNLQSAFASAGEAAKSRGGDCSEHAVLLAALLREAGIPSRVAAGLVYADQFAGERSVWAWHAWTQALVPTLDGKGVEWVDFDATLPVRFHAAHLCVAVGALEAGATDPMWTGTLSLIGNLSILDLRDDDKPATSESAK